MHILRRMALFLIALIVLPLSAFASTLTVTFFDVGQADAALVVCGEQALLVDAGTNESADRLVDMLRSQGITQIDYAVGSHPHEDHIGGLDAVIDAFDVKSVWMPRVEHNTRTFEDVLLAIQRAGLRITQPTVGATYALGDAVISILAPNSQKYSNLNNYSIVLRVDHGEASVLFTADAEALSEEEMLVASAKLDADLLKVGHHGSSTSSSEAFLLAVSPEYGIISCGAGNDYGHPHQEVTQALNNLGVIILRTDEQGSISFTSDGQAWSLHEASTAKSMPERLAAFGKTNADDVNIRAFASVAAQTAGSIKKANTPLYITGETMDEEGNVWYAVDTGESMGYIRSDLLAEISEAEYTSLQSAMDEGELTIAEARYIGNLSSHKFHRQDCSSLPAEKNRVYFGSAEDAVASGYDPCGNCKP